MSRSLIRRQMLDFEPYCPGLSIEEIKERYGLSSVIKLASNENPLGASPKALQAVEKQLTEVHRYPRVGSPRLCQALGAYHGVPADRIAAGNGSDEIIDLLIRVAVEPGRDHVVAFQPCFNIYRLQSKLCDVAFRQIALRSDFTFPLQELLEAVNDATAIVFLTAPDGQSFGIRASCRRGPRFAASPSGGLPAGRGRSVYGFCRAPGALFHNLLGG